MDAMRKCFAFVFWFFLGTAGTAFVSAAELPVSVRLSGKPGRYDKTLWKQDWPGCAFEGGIASGRVDLVKRAEGSSLRVNFAPGKIGPEAGGAGWRWPLGRHEKAEARYTVRFSPDFEFVKGGKLPGLCGGPENVSGGRRADGSNGFSARLMWRREGRGEAYVYHMDQPGDYGHSFPFPPDFRFPKDVPVQVRLAVTMNTPGRKDGVLRVWITLPGEAERLMVEKTDLQWRAASTFGVDGLYFEAFYGGGDESWAPDGKVWAEFGDIQVRP